MKHSRFKEIHYINTVFSLSVHLPRNYIPFERDLVAATRSWKGCCSFLGSRGGCCSRMKPRWKSGSIVKSSARESIPRLPRRVIRLRTRRDCVFLSFQRIGPLLLLFRARDSSRRGSAGFNDAFAVRVINRDHRTWLIFFAGVLLPVGFTTMSYIYRRSFAACIFSQTGNAVVAKSSSARECVQIAQIAKFEIRARYARHYFVYVHNALKRFKRSLRC